MPDAIVGSLGTWQGASYLSRNQDSAAMPVREHRHLHELTELGLMS
jgi:hypothetical protein